MIVNIEGNIFELRNRETCLVQQTLATGRYWEETQLRILFRMIDRTRLRNILIIGGHIGSLCIPLARKVLDNDGHVQVFEPHPGTFQHLVDNIRLNQLRNITAYNYGAGSKFEVGYFDASHPIHDSNNGHIYTQEDIEQQRRHSTGELAPHTVNIVPLDQVELSPFDLVIMDVEGMEYEILQHAKQKILQNQPIMMIEIWNNAKRQYENMHQSIEEVVQWIQTELQTMWIGNIADDHIFIPRKWMTIEHLYTDGTNLVDWAHQHNYITQDQYQKAKQYNSTSDPTPDPSNPI